MPPIRYPLRMTDRRSRPRASHLGRATLVSARHREPVQLGIRDLSASGARLVGKTQLLEGEAVRVTLELEGVSVAVPARVARTELQNAQVAVTFESVPADALAIIEHAVAALLERVRTSSRAVVIVVSAGGEIRDALERDLAQLALVAVPCASLSDAAPALDNGCEAIILESDTVGAALGPALLQLAQQHPKVRRIVLFADKIEALDRASSGAVDAVLRRPVRIRALARALGIRDTDSSVALLPQTD